MPRKTIGEMTRAREQKSKGVPNYELLLQSTRRVSESGIKHIMNTLLFTLGGEEVGKIGGHEEAHGALVRALERTEMQESVLRKQLSSKLLAERRRNQISKDLERQMQVKRNIVRATRLVNTVQGFRPRSYHA
jgi:hypothetical protein